MEINQLTSGLDTIFQPKSVAVIGASSTFAKWGQMILSGIVAGGYPGSIFPINPKESRMLGLPVYKTVEDIPGPVDLAFVMTPANTVLKVLEQCVNKGVKGVVLITSGFSETDAAGTKLERDITLFCRKQGLPLVGPNTMGIISPHASLFATASHTMPSKGSVAVISQSGNLGVQLIHWAEQQGIGISHFVGSGNEAMITCCDYLAYLENNPHTASIMLYIESVGNGRHFLEVARRVNRKKPVIILKGGRTEAGRTAAASHTGSMSGEDIIFKASCRQAGLLNVAVPSELLDLSAGFSSMPLPKGNRVGIVTLGGGWGVVTADECNEKGLVVPPIPKGIVDVIGRYLPPFWSKGNPVDMVGTNEPNVPIVAVEELLKWDGIDAVITLGIVGRLGLARKLVQSTRKVDASLPPDFLNNIETLAKEYEEEYIRKIVGLMETYGKPVVGVSLTNTNQGTVRPVEGMQYSGVFYQTPESAVNALSKMVAYYHFIQQQA